VTADEGELAAEQWFNRLKDDPTELLRNQFYLEEREVKSAETRPW